MSLLEEPKEVAGLALVNNVLRQRMGWTFGENRLADLDRGLDGAARELGLENGKELVRLLVAGEWSGRMADALGVHLTIGETYFWREPRTLEAFRDQALPELVRRLGPTDPLRLWSAGCASGEEAYTLAILLAEDLPGHILSRSRVYATDINQRFLQRAQQGSYRAWSFRDTPEWILQRYFSELHGETRSVVPWLLDRVEFSQLNLAQEPYPHPFGLAGQMDAIFIRNVLIYFGPRQIEEVISRLSHCLKPGGYLVVSPSETSLINSPALAKVSTSHATFFRKVEGSAALSQVPYSPGAAQQGSPTRATPAAGSLRAASTLPRVPVAPRSRTANPSLAAFTEALTAARVARTPVATPVPPAPAADMAAIKRMADGGRLQEALQMLDATLQAAKTNAEMHYLRASLLHELGREAEATAALRRVLYLEPDFVVAHLMMANIAARTQQAAVARRSWQTILDLLAPAADDAEVPHSDGLNAARLRSMAATHLEAYARRA